VKTIGLALGGGGARGVAHIAYLKALEQMGIKPNVIAGTSSGAIVGALYAGGVTPDEMYAMLDSLFGNKRRSGLSLVRAFKRDGIAGTMAKPFLSTILPKRTFEELDIPLKLVATNFHTLEEKVFASGEILPALMGSIAFPSVFIPQQVGDAYYVDGGATNIVPFDILRKECDVLIAIDVSQVRPNSSLKPSLKNALHATWAATQEALIAQKLKESPVDIFERPTFEDVSTLEFYKFKSIYKRAEDRISGFVEQLKKVL
jgi:NTE family protein